MTTGESPGNEPGLGTRHRLEAYFERIRYDGDVKPTLETLRALQRQHVLNVPFENLDVQLGRPLTTDPEAALDKIVFRGRGGWCYEQNGLFGWVLSKLGFSVTRVAAAVMRLDRGPVSSANHLCLIVGIPEQSGRRYLADVGFGGSLIHPLPLTETDDVQAPFRVGLRRLHDGHWQFWENDGGGEFSYDFLAGPGDERDLADRCDYLQNDPASGFVLNLVAQRRTPDEHKTLRGRVYTVRGTSGKKETVVPSPDALVEILGHDFGLHVPEVSDLWPRIVERHKAFTEERRR